MSNITEESNTTELEKKNVEVMDATEFSSDPHAVTPARVYGPNENRRMLKNVFLISFAFTFLFTAFQSMASLQSSLNTVSLTIY